MERTEVGMVEKPWQKEPRTVFSEDKAGGKCFALYGVIFGNGIVTNSPHRLLALLFRAF